jgi:murein DD-endopeptidase MepM/ murein hydrolase activator NlpD
MSIADASEAEVREAFPTLYNQCPDVASYVPCTLPVDQLDGVRISSSYGKRLHPLKNVVTHHNGIDIASPKRSVISTASGWIKETGYSNSLGNFVKIDHGNTYETTYGHLSSVSVKSGDFVILGDKIGIVGSTGSSTGLHIHYEIRKNHISLNPINYLLLLYEGISTHTKNRTSVPER